MNRLGGALVVLFTVALLGPPSSFAQTAVVDPASTLSVEQITQFLKTAKVLRSKTTDKGVTSPKRLTLSDGSLTHDAVFQAIDERKMVETLGGGARATTTELNFVDSYKYNIAAYELARLVGLDQMMPVYVERRWNGATGSISWFVPTLMDESDRLKKKIEPPRAADWNHQMYRMRVFSALVRDTDRNLTNVLITPDWKLVMIDFTRGFRVQPALMNLADLHKIDRALLAKLQALSKDEVRRVMKDYLGPREIDPLMQRRDLLVAHFKKLIADLGEERVLY